MPSNEEPDSDWEAAPLDWFMDDLPPPTKPVHQPTYDLWMRAEMYRVENNPPTYIRFSTRQRTHDPYEWRVPFSAADYRLEKFGDVYVLTFLPINEEIYRGPGPVEIVTRAIVGKREIDAA